MPDLPTRLSSLDLFCAVPPNTPLEEPAESVPSAGPYYIASYDPEHGLVLRRNPNYGGERPQGLEEIRIDFGVPLERGVEEVEAGRADYVPLRPGEGTLPVSARVLKRLEATLWPRERGRAGRPPAAIHAGPGRRGLLRLQHPERPVRRPAPAPGGELRDQSPRALQGHGVRARGQADRPVHPARDPGVRRRRDLSLGRARRRRRATARGGRAPPRRALHVRRDRLHPRRADPAVESGGDRDRPRGAAVYDTETYFRTISERPPAWDIAYFGWYLDYVRSLRLHQRPVRARRGRGGQQLPTIPACGGGWRPPPA